MKTLLSIDCPKYKRRLIRAVNTALRAGGSVYVAAYPYPCKVLSVSYGPNTNKIITRTSDNRLSAEGQQFFDGQNEIVASREQ